MRNALLLIVLASLLAFQPGTAYAQDAFERALLNYNAGRYQVALDGFSGIRAKYPDNALVHYYLALCHQALNHQSEARSEFEFVSARGNAKLRANAAAGLQQISRLRSQIGVSRPVSKQPSKLPSENKPAVPPPSKVKRIIEFYADW